MIREWKVGKIGNVLEKIMDWFKGRSLFHQDKIEWLTSNPPQLATAVYYASVLPATGTSGLSVFFSENGQ